MRIPEARWTVLGAVCLIFCVFGFFLFGWAGVLYTCMLIVGLLSTLAGVVGSGASASPTSANVVIGQGGAVHITTLRELAELRAMPVTDAQQGVFKNVMTSMPSMSYIQLQAIKMAAAHRLAIIREVKNAQREKQGGQP